MTISKLTTRYRVTLPKIVRKRLGVGPGDKLEFVEKGGQFRVRKLRESDEIRRSRGH